MRSPGSNGVIDDRRWISASAPKMRSDVRLFCISSPFTVQPEGEVVGIGELVGGDDPRPGGAEPGERLAEAELRCRRAGLHDPLGQVLADRDTGDVGPAVALGHLVGAPADDEHELDLPVDELAGQHDRGVGPGEARRELRERRRELRDVESGLGGVAGVVDADREHLAGPGHRREQRRLVQRSGRRRRRGPRLQLVPSLVDRLRVRREPAGRCFGDVDDPVVDDEHEPSVVVGELHDFSVCLVGVTANLTIDLRHVNRNFLTDRFS